MQHQTHHAPTRFAVLLLSLCLSCGGLVACTGQSEIPSGYQYATCAGEYFRLFVPTQWTVNTQSGMSAAYLDIDTSVSMREVPFDDEVTDPDGTVRTATLDDFRLSHLRTISALRDFAMEDDEMHYATLSSYKAVNMTYAATVAGTQYRFRQVLCRVEGRFYLFTYTACKDAFDRYMDVVDEILDNILFYNTPYEGSGETKTVSDKVTAPEGMQLVSTDKVAYRFFVPLSWEIHRESGVDLVYMTESDGSRSNVTMMSYMPEDEGFSVADYWSMCKLHYEDSLPDFTIVSTTEEETMGDRKATVYEYTYTLGGVSYRTRQVICVYSTMVYTQTYTALPAWYDSHLEDVRAMQSEVVFRSPFT